MIFGKQLHACQLVAAGPIAPEAISMAAATQSSHF